MILWLYNMVPAPCLAVTMPTLGYQPGYLSMDNTSSFNNRSTIEIYPPKALNPTIYPFIRTVWIS